MTQLAFYDSETNGLLQPKLDKGVLTPPMNKVHCLAILLREHGKPDRRISAADQPGYAKNVWAGDGQGEHRPNIVRGWERMGIVDALRILEQADIRIAFNGQGFDEGPLVNGKLDPGLGAIPLAYPWVEFKDGSYLIDPLILSRLIYPDILKSGPNGHKLLPFQKGQHNLKAWGLRLGVHKGDYSGGWETWTEDMQGYMEQDVEVLVAVFQWLMAQKPSAESSAIEHEFAGIIRRQERRGVAFDHDKANILLGELRSRQQSLEAELIEAFGEWWAYGKAANSSAKDTFTLEDDEDEEDEAVQDERRKAWEQREEWGAVVVPTVTRRVKLVGLPDVTLTRFSEKTGKPLKAYVGPPLSEITQGHAYTPIKRIQFNPGSRAHIFTRLIAKYAWQPSKFTKGGKNSPPQPKVDDDILRGLSYPEAQRLADYYLVAKRIGQLAEGKKAWMKTVRETELPNGTRLFRIHGRMITNGAVTGRCTHMDPNMSQVPKNTAAEKVCAFPEVQGYRCRDLFVATPPYGLVGFDGAGLELRMCAHYMWPWDNGAYADIISQGKKEDGTDPHSWMRTEIIGEDIIGKGEAGRDNAKTTIYAIFYGGGDEKVGSIILPTASTKEKRELGGEVKEKIFSRFEALGKLRGAIEEAVESRGHLLGLDGRVLRVRKAHAALNTLLQSAGAIVMKKTLIVLDAELRAIGLRPTTDYEFVLNIHDEAQAEVLPDHYPEYRRLALAAHPTAGKLLRVLCPLKAEVSPLAHSWKETH